MPRLLLLTAVLCVLCTDTVFAEEAPEDLRKRIPLASVSRSGYGSEVAMGPTSTRAALVEGDTVKKPVFSLRAFDRLLKPYFDWKGRINTRHKFQFGADYNVLYQRVDDSPGAEEAASQVVRVYGEWLLVNRCGPCGQGSLVWKFESRNALGGLVSPQGLGSEFGYGGITGALFSDLGFFVGNFFWKQRFGSNRGVLILGQLDPTDYLDVAGLANPFGTWQNLSVLVDPTIPLPNQGLGFAGSWMFDGHWYVVAGLSDANAIPTRDFTQTWHGFETFKHAEFGWAKSRGGFYEQNAHVMLWHQGQREGAGTPEAWGWAASATQPLGCGWALAARAGWSSAAVGFAEKHAGAMLQYSFNRDADAVGIGVGWDDVWGALHEDQVSAELFLRAQLAQNLALTPSLQWIKNPAYNPADDEAWLFGLRLRITL